MIRIIIGTTGRTVLIPSEKVDLRSFLLIPERIPALIPPTVKRIVMETRGI